MINMPGARAGLIFVDKHPYTQLAAGNAPGHILFCFHQSMVTITIVGGQVLIQDRQLLNSDEEAITTRTRQLASGVWGRANAQCT